MNLNSTIAQYREIYHLDNDVHVIVMPGPEHPFDFESGRSITLGTLKDNHASGPWARFYEDGRVFGCMLNKRDGSLVESYMANTHLGCRHPTPKDRCPGCTECDYCLVCYHRLYCKDV